MDFDKLSVLGQNHALDDFCAANDYASHDGTIEPVNYPFLNLFVPLSPMAYFTSFEG